MKRRSFIKAATASTVIPVALNGMQLRSVNNNALLKALGKRGASDKVLVIIQLNGGNDGLNTLLPLDQYSNLSKARSNVLIPEDKAIGLSDHSEIGFHPQMSGLNNIYNNKKLNIIQSVGYPQPNFSHFRSTDIWMSASDSNKVLTTGWMGRYLNEQYPNYPDNYPNSTYPDPLAIQIGPLVSLSFMGPNTSMGMAITDPSSFYELLDNSSGNVPSTPAGEELAYIRMLAQQTNEYADVIKAAAANGSNKSTKYPISGGRNTLGEQLKIVAKLISGGLSTRVYMVSLGGFDTHSAQTDSTDTTLGNHSALLAHLSQSIEGFQDDLELLGISDKVTGMTFSEFGRRIQSNASGGTDHGAAAPMFVFGDAVQPGVIGNNPSIPSTTTVNDNVPMQFDFRQVYASVLKDWFELNDAEIKNILGTDFNTLPIFKNNISGIDDIAEYMTQISLRNVFPNPAKNKTIISFSTDGGGNLSLVLYNAMGNQLYTFFNKRFSAGTFEHELDLRGFSPGNYILQLHSEMKSCTQTLQILN